MDASLDRQLDPVRFLASTPVRLHILEALAEGPLSKGRLRDELGVPRTTLRRNLAALSERHWVTEDLETNRYRLSVAGRFAVERFSDAVAALDTASTAGAFLGQFPEELPVDTETLSRLSFRTVTRQDPHRPVTAVRDALAESDQLHCFTPVLNPVYVPVVTELVAEGFEFHVVAPSSLYETCERNHPEALATLQGAETAKLRVNDAIPEFGLGLLDDRLLLGAHDERMQPHAVAAASREIESLEEWATDRYSRYLESSEPLSAIL